MAGAAADEDGIGPGRVAIDEEIAIGAVFILADARFRHRRRGKGGEAPGHIGAGEGDAVGAGDAVAGIGVHGGTVLVLGDLEAARFEIGKAIDDVAIVPIGPAGQAGGAEAVVTGGRHEEADFLSRREDAAAEQGGEEFGQPWPGGEDEAPGGEGFAGGGGDGIEVGGIGGRADAGLAIMTAGADEAVDKRLDGAAGHEGAELRFVEAEQRVGKIDLGPAALQGGAVQLLERQAEALVHGDAVAGIGFVVLEEEQHAGGVEDGEAGGCGQRLPFAERFMRHAGVDFIGAIVAARHARFAARGGAGMGRAPGIDEQDLLPGGLEPAGGPGAEHPGADDDGVPHRRGCGARGGGGGGGGCEEGAPGYRHLVMPWRAAAFRFRGYSRGAAGGYRGAWSVAAGRSYGRRC